MMLIAVEQDGRDFYYSLPSGIGNVKTIVDHRRGDTTENAIEWRAAFLAWCAAEGYAPEFDKANGGER